MAAAERQEVRPMIKEESLSPNECDYSEVEDQSLRDYLETVEKTVVQKRNWPLRYEYLASCRDKLDLSSSQILRIMHGVTEFGIVKREKALHTLYGQKHCRHVITISADDFRALVALIPTFVQFEPNKKIPWKYILKETKKALGSHYLAQQLHDDLLDPSDEESQPSQITGKKVVASFTPSTPSEPNESKANESAQKAFPEAEKQEDKSKKAVTIEAWGGRTKEESVMDKKLLSLLTAEIIQQVLAKIPDNKVEEISLVRVNRCLTGTIELTNGVIADLLYMRASLKNALEEYSRKALTLDFSYAELRDALLLVQQLILLYKLTNALDVYTRLKKRDLEQKRIQSFS